MSDLKFELFNDHFQNYKVYNIPKAQLVIADIPYNVGKNAYGFEIKKDFFKLAKEKVLNNIELSMF